ncbi:MAG: cation diffusion facilitator family transporter, partial [Acutalibacteraceae bacterium]|nr:cation diffusion facilitator family transporter [Acutalibacteraceae bacterium]
MSMLIIKLFVKDYRNTQSEKVRIRLGTLSGVVGILINVILSVFKMIFGFLTKSVSIIADGTNNIFDAVSSVISLIGFKISGKPSDKEHPFGHGRIEYISALTLAFFILIMGVELIKTSIDKFKNPEAVIFSVPAVIVLILSIFGKIWLALFNRKIGKMVNSVTVNAVITDCIGDIAATLCSLIALIASKYTDLPIDAVMGIIVALVILYAGINIIKETMGPLLGEPPDKKIVEDIEKLVLSSDGVVGIHDLVVHTYGHAKIFASIHAEVPADVDILQSHDTIDMIEKKAKEELGIELSIHLDPVISDERTFELKELAAKTVASICEDAT